MKFHCANNPAWHFEFSDSICPVCHGRAVRSIC